MSEMGIIDFVYNDVQTTLKRFGFNGLYVNLEKSIVH